MVSKIIEILPRKSYFLFKLGFRNSRVTTRVLALSLPISLARCLAKTVINYDYNP